METVAKPLLDFVRQELLDPERVAEAVRMVNRKIEDMAKPTALAAKRAALEAQIAGLQTEVGRLVEALAKGTAYDAISAALADKDARLKAARGELAAPAQPSAPKPPPEALCGGCHPPPRIALGRDQGTGWRPGSAGTRDVLRQHHRPPPGWRLGEGLAAGNEDAPPGEHPEGRDGCAGNWLRGRALVESGPPRLRAHHLLPKGRLKRHVIGTRYRPPPFVGSCGRAPLTVRSSSKTLSIVSMFGGLARCASKPASLAFVTSAGPA